MVTTCTLGAGNASAFSTSRAWRGFSGRGNGPILGSEKDFSDISSLMDVLMRRRRFLELEHAIHPRPNLPLGRVAQQRFHLWLQDIRAIPESPDVHPQHAAVLTHHADEAEPGPTHRFPCGAQKISPAPR